MLGLDQLTEGLLVSLAAATGVSRPAQPGSAAEAKQLAALAALVALASGGEAGFLGSGWLIVLRTLSALDSLKVAPAPLCFHLAECCVYQTAGLAQGMGGESPSSSAGHEGCFPKSVPHLRRLVLWTADRF